MSSTVHDFADSGLGTAPLVSYDHQHFYVIYSALDNNLKIYASHDQGNTWTGPITIVAGNAPESTIAGPLTYEGGALTSPGTNVAIDGHGRLHVLYIDSNKRVPMYTTSHDQGAIWSAPVNVNPKRAGDAHMWPCLFCTRHGALQGGSLVYDATLSKFSILLQGRPTTNGKRARWTVVHGLRRGRLPGSGSDLATTSIATVCLNVAWSETANGLQPWQIWARVLDICEHDEDRVAALVAEIERLTEAFESKELPFQRTPAAVDKFEGNLAELNAKLRLAQETLARRRAANPLPPD